MKGLGRFLLLCPYIFALCRGVSSHPLETETVCVPESRYKVGQVCLAHHAAPSRPSVLKRGNRALLSRSPFNKHASSIPRLSRTYSAPSAASEAPISFQGLPPEEYMGRAKFVYDHRVPAWNSGIGVGGSCTSSTAKCNSGLRCVGPLGQEQCHAAAKPGEDCNYEYKICRPDLVCKKETCMTPAQAFTGVEGDDCGGPAGRVCEAWLGCTNWNPNEAGTCERYLSWGTKHCKEGSGRRCQINTYCTWEELKNRTRCLKKNRYRNQGCKVSLECKEDLVCIFRNGKKRCS